MLRGKGRPSLNITYVITLRTCGMLAYLHISPAAIARIMQGKYCSATLDEHEGRRYEALHD